MSTSTLLSPALVSQPVLAHTSQLIKPAFYTLHWYITKEEEPLKKMVLRISRELV